MSARGHARGLSKSRRYWQRGKITCPVGRYISMTSALLERAASTAPRHVKRGGRGIGHNAGTEFRLRAPSQPGDIRNTTSNVINIITGTGHGGPHWSQMPTWRNV